jgi:hypothetical protein
MSVPTQVEPLQMLPPTQIVSQQAASTTLILSRTMVTQQHGSPIYHFPLPANAGPMQVEVKTDPSSPAVGVNVPALDQVVTFGRGQTQAAVNVPILTGAPNPGEVDVLVAATPLNPPTPVPTSASLKLRILASSAPLAPTVVAARGTAQGIVLTFNRPMDPAAASNVGNYAVRVTVSSFKGDPFWNAINTVTLPIHMDSGWGPNPLSVSTVKVPLRSAEYDPATNSVTLVPRRRMSYSAKIVVTQGSGTAPSRAGQPTDTPPGLTDAAGEPINADSTPGKFSVSFGPGS